MKNKLNKLFDAVCDVFVLFVFLVYGSLAINTAFDNPKYGIGTLTFSVIGYVFLPINN